MDERRIEKIEVVVREHLDADTLEKAKAHGAKPKGSTVGVKICVDGEQYGTYMCFTKPTLSASMVAKSINKQFGALLKKVEESYAEETDSTYRKVPDGAIVLTREELDALNEYNERIKRETVAAIFSDVTNLLRGKYSIFTEWAGLAADKGERDMYIYGRGVCEHLLIDLQKIERKHTKCD